MSAKDTYNPLDETKQRLIDLLQDAEDAAEAIEIYTSLILNQEHTRRARYIKQSCAQLLKETGCLPSKDSITAKEFK